MIYELAKEKFGNIECLLDGDTINLEIKSVVQGYNPGWVFVDNVDNPKSGVVWSKGIAGFYFIGDADNKDFNNNINSYIDSTLKSRAQALGLSYFEFSGTSDAWDVAIEKIFKDRDMSASKQYVFTHNKEDEPITPSIELTDGYELVVVDNDLLIDQNLDTEFAIEAIKEWWDSISDYLEHGIGYAIKNDKEIVCTCVTSFASKTQMQSHIQTKEDHRKKGLATIAVDAFVRRAKNIGLDLYWDCMETNHGSRALATRFGYNKKLDYKLYDFKL